ncbi:MAG: DUF2141 domain-containing protein [Proteobacteria bacterium]|nr:DUF2141 domain-containing protein [Pseudomonadota bacterium]
MNLNRILLFLFIVLNIGLTFSASVKSEESKKTTLTLILKNIKSDDGNICISVWDNPENYLKNDVKPYKYIKFPAKKEEMKITLKGLENGKSYAIFVHHDKDNVDKVKKGTFGNPLDPIGFSNNAKGMFGPPSYEETLVTVDNKLDNVHTITLE